MINNIKVQLGRAADFVAKDDYAVALAILEGLVESIRQLDTLRETAEIPPGVHKGRAAGMEMREHLNLTLREQIARERESYVHIDFHEASQIDMPFLVGLLGPAMLQAQSSDDFWDLYLFTGENREAFDDFATLMGQHNV